MATENTARIGEVVAGRFRITGTVGKGAMGAVFAAEHTGTGQRVALKFMALDGDDSAEFVARFEQEARVMAALKHPNTIRIYDFGRTDDGQMFMAMELLSGNGLDKVIRENTRQATTMGEAEAANYAIQILKSLAEAHGQGLVHRDLKPGNIMLTDDGGGEILCKVLDFGIARVNNSDMTGSGRLLGTPSYMSPEQWQGSKVDARADLYAVGCILYCCITGGPPFSAGDNAMALMTKHLHEAPPDPRNKAKQPLSEPFVQVVMTALAKDAGQRYADARAMRQALEAAIGGAWAGTPGNLSPGTPANLRRPSSALPVAAAPVRADEQATMSLQTDPRGQVRPTVAGSTLAFDAPANKPAKSQALLVLGGVVAAAVVAAGAWIALKPAAAPSAATASGVVAVPVAASPAPAPVPVPVPAPAPASVPAPAPVPEPVAAPTPSPAPDVAAPPAAAAAAPEAAPQPAATAPTLAPKAAAKPARATGKAPARPATPAAKLPAGGKGESMRSVD